jgi:hypothetical protein
MMHARRSHGCAQLHAEIDHIDDRLKHRRDDAAPARRTRHEERLAVFLHDGGRHRGERPLARAGRIGVPAHEPVSVRRIGRGGEIIEFVVQQNAGPLRHHADAKKEIECVGVGNRISETVGHRIMRGVIALELRRPTRLDLRRRARPPAVDCLAQFVRIAL